MATFTLTLKRVIELTGGQVSIVNGISHMAGGYIGLSQYELFDPAYRDTLNGKIIDHYWNQEIGQETIEMFQMAMRRKMNEIMPYYNQMYRSTLIEINPLSTVGLKTKSASETEQDTQTDGTQAVTRDGQTESESVAESKSRSVTSTTPQTQLSGNGDYATGAADAISSNESASTGKESGTASTVDKNVGKTTGTDERESETSGFQGAESALLMAYRETFTNIDMQVIAELKDLFMLVWANGDSFTPGGFYYGY